MKGVAPPGLLARRGGLADLRNPLPKNKTLSRFARYGAFSLTVPQASLVTEIKKAPAPWAKAFVLVAPPGLEPGSTV